MTHGILPDVTAVVLAYGPEPGLDDCLQAVLASSGVSVTLVLVDNGCASPAVERYRTVAGVRVLRPATNAGFSGGCNLGAAATADPMIVFINSDCVVDPLAIARLEEQARASDVGLVTASVRLAGSPGLLNSAGNPVHFLGFSWAGRCGEPARDPEHAADVASVSGACFGVRRTVWEQLDGFTEDYFAYHEDVDLSLRCWLAGLRVRYVPDAVALHDHQFSRNPEKMYLLERNRLLTWLTLLEGRTLALLAPALLLAEAATAVLAIRQGWLRQKVRAWLWLLGHARWLSRRRAVVRAQRRLPDGVLADVLTPHLRPSGHHLPEARLADAPLRLYWTLVRRWL